MDVRGGRHAGRVDGLELLGVVEDVGELPREELFLVAVSSRCASAAMRSTSAIVNGVDTLGWYHGEVP